MRRYLLLCLSSLSNSSTCPCIQKCHRLYNIKTLALTQIMMFTCTLNGLSFQPVQNRDGGGCRLQREWCIVMITPEWTAVYVSCVHVIHAREKITSENKT